MHELSLDAVWSRYQQARKRRRCWEGLWRDCYTYALPQRGAGFGQEFAPGRNPAERLFDSTAMDAVEQLAASLLAELTPPWSQWFGLVPGRNIGALDYGFFAEMLDGLSQSIQAHFDRSNFALEMHQAFLDLVTVGNATLLCEEAPVGSPSALRFTAIPMAEMVFDAGPEGQIQDHFRQSTLSPAALRARYPRAILPEPLRAACESEDERPMRVVEAVLHTGGRFAYLSLLDQDGGRPLLLDSGTFETSPFISFRWMKGAAEVYGRSPMMSALPDIKTVNKVVELILKNASIAVTGIWQADDDGVLNPANIRLVPGSIIPKAVGSAGLTPLQAPGRFDISSLMLDDLRSRIRRTLLADRLGPLSGPRMTATEVLERSNETARLLGATFGRLQTELLTPLLTRAFAILRRRGEVADLALDGRMVDLKYKSPLARVQARQDVENTLLWLEAAGKLGPEAMRAIDLTATAKWLGHSLGVPAQLVRDHEPAATLLSELIDGAAKMAAAEPDDGA
jgi:Bacteriophage head to tail connecting protein